MIRTTYPTSLRAAALLLGISVLPPAAQVVDPAWTLKPESAPAGQAFDLEALSYKYNCGHTFTNLDVDVSGSRIDLSFIPVANPAAMCPAIYKPYGPSFRIPALEKGRYSVVVNILSPCHKDPAPCLLMPTIEAAGTLEVGSPDAVTYSIDPVSATAGSDFTMNLLSPQFTCNLDYLRLASRVENGRITLTFLDKPNPLVRCAPEKQAYGPAFKLSGLNAGTYEVWAERLPACVEQGCKMAAIAERVGKLTVNPATTTRKGWFLKQKEVAAGSPFTLSVLNNDYGSCQTGFEHTSLQVSNQAISVSFLIVTDTSRVCIMDRRPHGPEFKVEGLKPGRYPVSIWLRAACEFTQPMCAIDYSMPLASDTLVVMQSLGLGGPAQAGPQPRAAWRGEVLGLSLPAGAEGIWRAEVLDLSGRKLMGATVDAGRGEALLPVRTRDRGILLVRLTGPEAGQTHLLRVPSSQEVPCAACQSASQP